MFVACDESGKTSDDKYLVIGSAWVSKEGLCDLERRTTELRLRRRCWGEIKWSKSRSESMLQFYKDFIELAFNDIEIDLRFIVIEKELLDMRTYHESEEELVFKFMHLLLSRHGKRFLDRGEQRELHIVFDNFDLSQQAREERWILKMRRFIERHLGVTIEHLQPCTSHICSLVQLSDLFTGAVATSWNTTPSRIGARNKELIEFMERKTGKTFRARTLLGDKDFNVWVWQPSPRFS